MLALRELHSRGDIRLFNALMSRYHKQGAGYGLSRARYFVGVITEQGTEYWVAGAVLQHPAAFSTVFVRNGIDMGRSYFIRRVARFVPSSCGDFLVSFLNAIADHMRGEGKEALVTLGLEDHTNKLYRLSNFVPVGKTKTGKPVFVRFLQAGSE